MKTAHFKGKLLQNYTVGMQDFQGILKYVSSCFSVLFQTMQIWLYL